MFNFKQNRILQALLALLAVWLLVRLREVVIIFFIAFLVTTVLHPLVEWLRRRRVPVGIAIASPLLLVVVMLGLLGYIVVPTLFTQGANFVGSLPSYLNTLHVPGSHGNYHFDLASLEGALKNHYDTLTQALLSFTTTFVTLLVGVVTVIVVSIYWTGSYDGVKATLLTYLPRRWRARAADVWTRMERKLRLWFAAQLLLSVAVGLLVWIGAHLLGLPFPGILGIISGLFEVIPTLGPIAAALPGILLGLSQSLGKGIAALILYIVVQQLENHILAPMLLGRTVKLHPMVIIFSLLAGSILVGIIGALLAVPAALAVSAAVDSYRREE